MNTQVKIVIFAAATVVCCGASRATAQNQGIDYYLVEQYDKAKVFFEPRLTGADAPVEKSEAAYYLGEIAYAHGNADQAKRYYEQGVEADPTYCLNHVGLAKLTPKSGDKTVDAKAIDKALSAAAKFGKKDVASLLAIAKVYYDNGLTEDGDDFVARAEKIGKKVPRSGALVWMFKGDRKKETAASAADYGQAVGAAAGDYDQAILCDPQYMIPYIRYAQVYVDIISQQPQSFPVVQEKLDAVLEAEPNNVIAKQYKARAYYNIIQYDKAIEIYKEIFDPELSSMSELTDYAASLFFIGQYEEATKLMNQGIAKDPTHFVLNRVLMYGALEKANAEVEHIKQAAAEERAARRQNDSLNLITITSRKIAAEHAAKAFYEEGIAAAQHFFSLPKGTNNYIVRDYVAYGNLLSCTQQPDSADVQYAKALELGKYEEDLETYEKIVATLDALGEAVRTAEYYKQSVEMKKTFDNSLGGDEYFKLGQYFYNAAKSLTKDPTAANAEQIDTYLNAADSAFAAVVELMPDNILNFMSRARTTALRDPNTETGVAQPLYEEALEKILKSGQEGKYKSYLQEIYFYLGYYYYLQCYAKSKDKSQAEAMEQDKAKSLEYSTKVLEIDPNHYQARQLVDALTPKAVPKKAPAKKSKK